MYLIVANLVAMPNQNCCYKASTVESYVQVKELNSLMYN